ncbi:MAG: formate--tetrahydrofolate ligase [Planctomycetes bacterium]|nr:formate--tetrahydrofolate ligase [Planctomycetota bacterium]
MHQIATVLAPMHTLNRPPDRPQSQTSHEYSRVAPPTGHTVRVREVRASVGAGFIYPLLGQMRTMPGLGMTPAYMNVDVDENGKVVGLF